MRMARIGKQGSPRRLMRVSTRDLRGNNDVVRKPPREKIEAFKESDPEPRAADFGPGDRVKIKGDLTPPIRLRFGLDLRGWRGITDFRVQGSDEKNNSVRIETGRGVQSIDPGRLDLIAQSIAPRGQSKAV